MKNTNTNKILNTRDGFLSISPLVLFVLLYLVIAIITGDFYYVPMSVVFSVAVVYGFFISYHISFTERIKSFGKGVFSPQVGIIIGIFILAGAFSECAKEMGCFNDTVNFALDLLPSKYIYAGIFIASCIISMATGSAISTVITLVPISAGLAHSLGINVSLITAIVVGGSFFGDNLSFISDTTIMATNTQGCKMSDKFKVNFKIVLPAAIILTIIYLIMGNDLVVNETHHDINFLNIIPYAIVIILALLGVNVLLVLSLGLIAAIGIGLSQGCFDLAGCAWAIIIGIKGMLDVIMLTLFSSGLIGIIRKNGGLDFVMERISQHVHSKCMAQMNIALMTVICTICTAMNTIAIITVGSLAKDMSKKYYLDSRKVASILDIFSCSTQGLLPYGAHLLAGASIAGVTVFSLFPFLLYPLMIAALGVLSIIFDFPKLKPQKNK